MPKLPTQAIFHGQVAANMKSVLQFMWEELARAINLNEDVSLIVDHTHAERLADYTAADYPLGSGFLESDRNVLYINKTVGGVNTWVYVAGTYVDVFANRPTDLGTADKGFEFYTNDLLTKWTWDSTTWNSTGGLYQVIANAASTTVSTALILQHLINGGAGANGVGVGLLAQTEDTAGAVEDLGSSEFSFTNATNGAETSDWILKLRNAGALLAKKFRVLASGAIELIGKIVLYNNAAPLDGQLLIGDTVEGAFDAAVLTQASANQVVITNGAGSITLALPQDIHTGASPTFAGLTISGAGGIGFFGPSGIGQQTSGANLTNNVTAGGTNDQIDNFTDLLVYSNDATAIRNDIYQLARKLKQVNDALRAYGLLT